MGFENFTFDLQRFKGNTTVENKYEPTEHELEGQRIAANYAGAVSPNALMLNNLASDEMRKLYLSIINGADQMYTGLTNQARDRQNTALDAMSGIINSVNQGIANTNGTIGGYPNTMNNGGANLPRLIDDKFYR